MYLHDGCEKIPELQDSMSFEHYCPKAMIAKWIYWKHIFSQMWLRWGFQCIFVSWIDRLCFLLFIRCKICQFYWGTIIHIKVSLTSAKSTTLLCSGVNVLPAQLWKAARRWCTRRWLSACPSAPSAPHRQTDLKIGYPTSVPGERSEGRDWETDRKLGWDNKQVVK